MKKNKFLLLLFITIPIIFSCNKKNYENISAKNKKSASEIRVFNMIYVEGGEYTMGNINEEDSFPHKVKVDDFYISDIEVTQALYEQLMGENPTSSVDDLGDNKPVINVKWEDTIEFCNMLSIKDGYEPCYIINEDTITCNFKANGYRLPTEAEWEYAARGGKFSNGYDFSGTNLDNLNDYAWWYIHSTEIQDVATKLPNELNIFDMTGNADEWCWDWYDENYYKCSPYDNPVGPNKSGEQENEVGFKVVRGGDYLQYYDVCYVYHRSYCLYTKTRSPFGFRICRTKID